MDFPDFARHQIALKFNSMRGVYDSSKRYTEEFKIEAVKQVTERGYSVADVAERLGTTTHSMYNWLKSYGEQSPQQSNKVDDQATIA